MFGISLFVHALRMVLNNLPAAIRLSAVPMLAQLVVALTMGGTFLFAPASGEAGAAGAAISAIGAVVATAVMLLTSLWVAVVWHRFVLCDEAPTGLVPPFDGAAVGRYLVASLIFGLIILAAALPVSLLVGLLLGPAMFDPGLDRPPGMAALLIGFALIYLPVAWVAYRVSPILPSAALGPRMPLKEAWYATGTSGAAFVVLTVVSVLAGWMINAPAQALPAALGLVWGFLANWLTVLVGASILTTIYGVYVEGRTLDG